MNTNNKITALLQKPFGSLIRLNRELVLFVITRLFMMLFLFSAWEKLYEVEKFRAQLGQSSVLTSIADYVAWGLPALEMIIAVLVILPRTVLFGLYACFGLMTMFTSYIIIIMHFSPYVPCSCNGILEGASWAEHLTFNVGFTAMALGAILLKAKIKIST